MVFTRAFCADSAAAVHNCREPVPLLARVSPTNRTKRPTVHQIPFPGGLHVGDGTMGSVTNTSRLRRPYYNYAVLTKKREHKAHDDRPVSTRIRREAE